MKRGVLALALAASLGGCTSQRDKAPAGRHVESPGQGAGATPRELATVGASDAGVTATALTGTPDAALAVKGAKPPGASAQQQLDEQTVRMLAALGSSRGSSRGSSVDKVLSQPKLDLSAAAASDWFASGTGSGPSGGGVNVGGSGGSIRAGSASGPGMAGGPGMPGGSGSPAPAGPRAVVTVESVTVVAGEVPAAVAGVTRGFSGVRACYQRRLSQNPDLAGTLRVSIVLDNDGRTRSTEVEADGFDEPQLVSCARDVLRRLSFLGASPDAELSLSIGLSPEP